jgi:diaminopimelate epimerase
MVLNRQLDIVKIPFIKIEGAGNDFVLIDNTESLYKISLPKFASVVCDRHRGIGADGILVLEKSTIADAKMRYLNADGSEGGMCGNGGRCVANYIISKKGKKKITIEALDYLYNAESSGKLIRLYMKNPTGLKKDLTFRYKGKTIAGDFIDTGSPHFVVFTKDIMKKDIGKDLQSLDVNSLGRFLRHQTIFDFRGGTNVNFVEVKKKGVIKIRTYERGVEEETLACGTGSVASAIISTLRYGWKPPVVVIPQSSIKLLVDFKIDSGIIKNVFIEGETNIVFQGEFNYSQKSNKITY